jgi:hypothetical protein
MSKFRNYRPILLWTSTAQWYFGMAMVTPNAIAQHTPAQKLHYYFTLHCTQTKLFSRALRITCEIALGVTGAKISKNSESVHDKLTSKIA